MVGQTLIERCHCQQIHVSSDGKSKIEWHMFGTYSFERTDDHYNTIYKKTGGDMVREDFYLVGPLYTETIPTRHWQVRLISQTCSGIVQLF